MRGGCSTASRPRATKRPTTCDGTQPPARCSRSASWESSCSAGRARAPESALHRRDTRWAQLRLAVSPLLRSPKEHQKTTRCRSRFRETLAVPFCSWRRDPVWRRLFFSSARVSERGRFFGGRRRVSRRSAPLVIPAASWQLCRIGVSNRLRYAAVGLLTAFYRWNPAPDLCEVGRGALAPLP